MQMQMIMKLDGVGNHVNRSIQIIITIIENEYKDHFNRFLNLYDSIKTALFAIEQGEDMTNSNHMIGVAQVELIMFSSVLGLNFY